VQIDSVSIPYDYLVLATGAAHSYFGRDEWPEVAPGLKRIEDATRIRRRILIAFERAELATEPSASASSRSQSSAAALRGRRA
jgi:NADH dehydrogenase